MKKKMKTSNNELVQIVQNSAVLKNCYLLKNKFILLYLKFT